MGENWESKPHGQLIPEKYRPSSNAWFRGTSRDAGIQPDGNVVLYGANGDNFWDYGYVMYQCAN